MLGHVLCRKIKSVEACCKELEIFPFVNQNLPNVSNAVLSI